MGLDSADKVWKKDETAALIALYESERVLYDKKDKHHLNIQKRNDGYDRIRQVMQRIRPECTVADIKSRIRYLRSQYASELLRRNISIESGLCTIDTYKPVMWCFGLLQFLDDFISKKKFSKIDTSEEEKSDNPDSDADNYNSRITSASKRNSAHLNDFSSSTEVTENNGASDAIAETRSRKKKRIGSPSSSESTSESVERVTVHSSRKKNKVGCPSSSGSTPDPTEGVSVPNSQMKKKVDGPPSPENSLETAERESELNCDREEIFGQYIASEMRALRDNPLLYLQTKQSILEILTSANFELINPE